MAKKLSLIVLADSGMTVKRFFFSRWQLTCLAALACGGLLVIFLGIWQYFSFQPQLAQQSELEAQLRAKKATAALQKRQIQTFTAKIDELKYQLATLNQLEADIRSIANIDHRAEGEDVFGVGGSSPDGVSGDPEVGRDIPGDVALPSQSESQVGSVIQLNHRDNEIILETRGGHENLLAHTPSIAPVPGTVVSGFGYRRSPFSQMLEFHKGVDLTDEKGTPVVSTADGVVYYTGINGPLGRTMIIDHGFGITTRYGHIHESLKQPGDRVNRGDIIALMGPGGTGTDGHLYYEIRLYGVPVNPAAYISD